MDGSEEIGISEGLSAKQGPEFATQYWMKCLTESILSEETTLIFPKHPRSYEQMMMTPTVLDLIFEKINNEAPFIDHVVLSGKRISDEGIKVIISKLRENKSIISLDLRNNGSITDESAREFLQFCQNNENSDEKTQNSPLLNVKLDSPKITNALHQELKIGFRRKKRLFSSPIRNEIEEYFDTKIVNRQECICLTLLHHDEKIGITKKLEKICKSVNDCPFVKRLEFECLGLDDDELNLIYNMLQENKFLTDLKIREKFKEKSKIRISEKAIREFLSFRKDKFSPLVTFELFISYFSSDFKLEIEHEFQAKFEQLWPYDAEDMAAQLEDICDNLQLKRRNLSHVLENGRALNEFESNLPDEIVELQNKYQLLKNKFLRSPFTLTHKVKRFVNKLDTRLEHDFDREQDLFFNDDTPLVDQEEYRDEYKMKLFGKKAKTFNSYLA